MGLFDIFKKKEDKITEIKDEKVFVHQPAKYERGRYVGNEYVSECLRYRVRIPEGCFFMNTASCENNSDEIIDLWVKSGKGVEVKVSYVPGADDMPIIDDNFLEFFGNESAKRMNSNDEDCVASYNGIKEFVGRRCTNNLVQRYNDGRIILVEMYAGFTPYYMIQFLFVYDDGNIKEADRLKSAFSGL